MKARLSNPLPESSQSYWSKYQMLQDAKAEPVAKQEQPQQVKPTTLKLNKLVAKFKGQ